MSGHFDDTSGGSAVEASIAQARAAFLWACELDVATPKPGNVSVANAGHGMQATMFVDSARACAPFLFERGATVGARIEAAMKASLAVAGCNTNLGIVLLVAPLAAAVERLHPGASVRRLRAALEDVLLASSVDDAAAAFRAIAATNPGGLGKVTQHDVSGPATITLLEAMALAAPRDRVAHQYASRYQDIFDLGLNAFLEGFDARVGSQGEGTRAARDAMLGLFLAFLAKMPDSHIARRHGDAVAQTVMEQTLDRWKAWSADASLEVHRFDLERWDDDLKRAGINPGTTADLCVATATVAGWLGPWIMGSAHGVSPPSGAKPSERTDPAGHGS